MNAALARVAPKTDRDSQEWWAAVRAHEFRLQLCSSCDLWRWPSRSVCARCHSFGWTWEPTTNLGTVVTWITTHHAVVPGFEPPYHTVIVRPDLAEAAPQEDLLMPGIWCGAITPAIGMRVRVKFEDLFEADGSAFTLVGWTPVV
jgi:uncharacterized OB-fold protein